MLLIYFVTLVLLGTLLYWTLFFLSAVCISGDIDQPSTLRLVMTLLLPLVVAVWGLKQKHLDWTGTITGLLIGCLVTLSNCCFLASLLAFFISSSRATKFCAKTKCKLDSDFKEGGQRNWVQVICNSGVAAELALIFMIFHGIGEKPIDFRNHYSMSMLQTGVLASIAGANGDTWASELGSVLSSGEPWLITSFQQVPRGTNGGVSWIGFGVSALGGTIVGLCYYMPLMLLHISGLLNYTALQFPILIITSTFAGLFGSVIDSVLGATFQYSGVDSRTRKIVDHGGKGVKHISGLAILDNHSVNLLMSIITALIVPNIAAELWNIQMLIQEYFDYHK